MTEQPPQTPPSIGHHMVRGSVWMIAMRWSVRGIGLLSTAILARVLMPSDFGMIAMATMVLGLLEVLSALGVDASLIQNIRATRKHYDTAWTVRLIRGFLLAIVLVLVAPVASEYFGEPRLIPVIRVLAVLPVIASLQNIGVVAFRKELDFGKEFRFNVYQRLITLVATISLLLFVRSYWVLLFGIITGTAVGVILSYSMHPYRPRLSLAAFGHQWSFSQWALLNGLAAYLYSRLDQLIVGRVTGPTAMGNYHVAFELSNMATDELASPVARALFPGYAKIQDNPAAVNSLLLNSQGVLAIMSLSIGFGVAAVAEDAVAIILGPQWEAAVPLVQWLAISGGLAVPSDSASGTVLIAMGRMRMFVALSWLRVVLLAPALLAAGTFGDIEEIAMARTAAIALLVPLIYYFVTRVLPVSLREIVAILWRPLAASVTMFIMVRSLHVETIDDHVITLAIDAFVGAVTFGVTLFVLWWISGLPRGAERSIVDYAAAHLGWPTRSS